MGNYTFTAASGAAMHTAEFRDSSGDTSWTVALLDGSTSFTLPTLSPDPLPAGDVTLVVNAFAVPSFDPEDFEILSLIDSLTAISANATDFTH
jgi:hypothetical protein